MEESKALEIIPAPQSGLSKVTAEDFMPLMTVAQAVQRKQNINDFTARVFKESEDYGVIPGTNSKPVLLKPGAEKLCSIFGLVPRFIIEDITEDWTGEKHNGEPFFYYRYRCELWRGDRLMGDAVGSCNSWEAKYRWRDQSRKCPACGAEAIIKGKAEWGGGWLCFKKKGGCGEKYADDDATITGQKIGRVPNPDIADQVNTLQKMAQKRALIPVVLIVTNCSDAFTQDLEDQQPSQQQNTPEQQEALAKRRIEETKADANVPVELRVLFGNSDKPGGMKHGLEVLLAKMKEALPESGERTYKRIVEAHGVKRGCDIKALKAAMLEMWDLIKLSEETKAKTAEAQQPKQQYVATDDDVPSFDFAKEEIAK